MAKLLSSTLAYLVAAAGAKSINVLVFGDSYGDTGPTYKQVQKMFDDRGVSATVRSAAIGGTAACDWSILDDGNSIVNNAKKHFPNLQDGPDFLWYTAGANDVWQSLGFKACEGSAKDWDGVHTCMHNLMQRVSGCTEKMLKKYIAAFPKSKIMQSGYDVPCYNALCTATFTGVFDLAFCGKHSQAGMMDMNGPNGVNITCNNQAMHDLISIYQGYLTKVFSEPQYTVLFMMGAVQKAAGIKGADVGKPVLSQGSNCAWETECVHPTYNSPAGKAWEDAFWNLYFSKHISANATAHGVVV